MGAKVDLGTFEDQEIVGTPIVIRNTGDGLSKAMGVDPKVLHSGDTVFVVLECVVGSVSFDPVKDADGKVERKHVLKAGRATFIDRKVVVKTLDETAKAIQAARDEQTGALALDLDADPLGVGESGPAKAKGAVKKAPGRKARARKSTAKKGGHLASVPDKS